MNEPTKEVKHAIIANEITRIINTRWQLEIRHKVNKKLGHTAEQLKPIEDELVKLESALAEYEKIQEDVKKEK